MDVNIENDEQIQSTRLPKGVLITSPLNRAKQTAELLGFADYSVDERIGEINLGELEGVQRSSIVMARINNMQYDPDDNSHGGESLNMFRKRIKSFFDEFVERSRDNDIIVITHAGVMRLIFTEILDLTDDTFQPDHLEMVSYDITSETMKRLQISNSDLDEAVVHP